MQALSTSGQLYLKPGLATHEFPCLNLLHPSSSTEFGGAGLHLQGHETVGKRQVGRDGGRGKLKGRGKMQSGSSRGKGEGK